MWWATGWSSRRRLPPAVMRTRFGTRPVPLENDTGVGMGAVGAVGFVGAGCRWTAVTLGGATSGMSTLGGGSAVVGVTPLSCHFTKTSRRSEMAWSWASARTTRASLRSHVKRRTACTILSTGVRVGWVRYECTNSTVSEIDVALVFELTTLK